MAAVPSAVSARSAAVTIVAQIALQQGLSGLSAFDAPRQALERVPGLQPHGPSSSARFDAGTDVPGIGPDERRVATTPSRHKILIEKLRLHLRANCPLMAIKHDSADRPGSRRRRSFRGD